MDSSPHSLHRLQNNVIRSILEYFHKFNFPLTAEEVWYWQSFSHYPKSFFSRWRYQCEGLLYLPGQKRLVASRKHKEKVSLKKLNLAHGISSFIKKIPFIRGIFITGSLSMLNCPENDDIDLLIITSPDTVWICRPLVILALKLMGVRRDYQLPEHSSARVSDKICDNLYLDSSHLVVINNPANRERNLYLAHEVLQAKPIFDTGGIYREFIQSNSWIKDVLPVAYGRTVKNMTDRKTFLPESGHFLLRIANLFLFFIQYAYMRKGMYRENVGIGYAYFHPR